MWSCRRAFSAVIREATFHDLRRLQCVEVGLRRTRCLRAVIPGCSEHSPIPGGAGGSAVVRQRNPSIRHGLNLA